VYAPLAKLQGRQNVGFRMSLSWTERESRPDQRLPGPVAIEPTTAPATMRWLAVADSISREFTLGIEALERFVRKEPLRRTHECVFGVLALESEPVDPRL
jgi:hypothetical protein